MAVAAALVLGVVVQLLPLLVFPTVLSQDGPAHVASAWVLLTSGHEDATGALLRDHYRVDLTPVPNMLTTLVLVALLPLAGPDGAERLLVAGLVVGLVAALAYAVRGVDRRAGWLAAAALPLAGSQLVAYGFDNFVLGVVGALLVLGVALRRRSGWGTPAGAALAALLVLTWTAHLLPWVLAAGSVLLLAAARAGDAVRAGDRARDAVRRHVAPVLLATVPSAALTARYLSSGDGPPAEGEGGPSPERVRALLTGVRPFVTGWGGERVPALVTVLAIAVLTVAALRRARPGTPVPRPERLALGLLAAGVTLAYWLTPDQLGPDFGFLPARLAWFPPLLLVLWAATRVPGPRTAAALTAVLVLAASVAALGRLPAQAAAADEVAELLSVAHDIPPASTLVVLHYQRSVAWAGRGSPDPLRHESSRLAVRAGGVDVGHYEAVQAYFQVHFAVTPGVRQRMDPALSGLEQVPPVVDLAAVRGELDYVVVVGLDRASAGVRDAQCTRAVTAELADHYTPVATSAPTGLVTLWRAAPSSGQTADGGSADPQAEGSAAAPPQSGPVVSGRARPG
ncbi:hypothetical protein DQ238_05250 [Geodermatophilus sp. TF02-6]|uniref:hypothetical protein n=1 Tax=Geodermatophilus sp. TF02-6 TaxID=2250575 RepID=UPI000DEA21B1|nr:hypothetical protein [Geodermatophilus sp. TF02-6]RBY82021.1 hypothetical protein DQ238_05250 [Geodermatophilus sp. TF02-6]